MIVHPHPTSKAEGMGNGGLEGRRGRGEENGRRNGRGKGRVGQGNGRGKGKGTGGKEFIPQCSPPVDATDKMCALGDWVSKNGTTTTNMT